MNAHRLLGLSESSTMHQPPNFEPWWYVECRLSLAVHAHISGGRQAALPQSVLLVYVRFVSEKLINRSDMVCSCFIACWLNHWVTVVTI